MQEATGRSTPIAGILAVLGGALLALGSFLAWAEVSGGGTSVTAKGVDGSDGWITLVAGAILALAGITFFRATGKKAIAILAIVAGLVGGGVGLYDALTAKDRVLDDAAEELAPQVGGTPEQVRALLDQAIDAGEIGISISIGLYMVIAGGALGIVGGVLGMKASAPAPAMAASTTMPAAAPAPAEPAAAPAPAEPAAAEPATMPVDPPAPPTPPPPAPGDANPS